MTRPSTRFIHTILANTIELEAISIQLTAKQKVTMVGHRAPLSQLPLFQRRGHVQRHHRQLSLDAPRRVHARTRWPEHLQSHRQVAPEHPRQHEQARAQALVPTVVSGIAGDIRRRLLAEGREPIAQARAQH